MATVSLYDNKGTSMATISEERVATGQESK